MITRHATHERLVSDEIVQDASDRAFGLVFGAVFTIAGLWPIIAGGPVRIWALGLAIAYLLAATKLSNKAELPSGLPRVAA